jgi:hypothetical protein
VPRFESHERCTPCTPHTHTLTHTLSLSCHGSQSLPISICSTQLPLTTSPDHTCIFAHPLAALSAPTCKSRTLRKGSHKHSQIPTFVCHECVANQRTAQVSTTSSNIRASASTALHTAAFACHVLIRLAPTQRTRCHPSSWSQGPVQGVQVVERFQRVA